MSTRTSRRGARPRWPPAGSPPQAGSWWRCIAPLPEEAQWRGGQGGDADAPAARAATTTTPTAGLGTLGRVERPGEDSFRRDNRTSTRRTTAGSPDGGERVAVAAGDIIHLRAAGHP
ncbi:hypothetical protein HBB16_01445 [Pseudonocardia sp. MCCB 268]|nr:hypothetical protein [Pseudonocardia cytotoxica]